MENIFFLVSRIHPIIEVLYKQRTFGGAELLMKNTVFIQILPL